MSRLVNIMIQVSGLYLLYQIGKWIQQAFGLLIPGNIIGMIFLFLLLYFKVVKPIWIERGASFLLSNLPLLFLPVTVGVMNYYEMFLGKGALSLLVAFISTGLVMGGSGLIGQLAARKRERENA